MTDPLIRFLIGGVQKGGTSALASYLGSHPAVHLPVGKEAHVFDDPRAHDWSAARIDAAYHTHFPGETTGAAIHGDATPIYCFHSRLIERIARYNRGMKWIILLRDPVDRAISQYYMERDRGHESLPLWAALLAEPWRLHGHLDDFTDDSPLRRHSYCARGRYARQLNALHAHFPRDCILILRSMDLLAQPSESMKRVYAFLGLAPPSNDPVFQPVFQGPQGSTTGHPWVRWALRQRFRRELSLLRARHGVSFDADTKHDPAVA